MCTEIPALADMINVSYSEYSADITELNSAAERIRGLIAECEAQGLSVDYEIMRVNIVERYTGYLRSELLNGVAYRTDENGYTEEDVRNIYYYNVECLKDMAQRTEEDLGAYLSGEKDPFSVPEILTSETEIEGRTLYAETELNGETQRGKVFLNGVGHYSAYEDMDFLKATGCDIIQMEIGLSSHCHPASGIKDWIAGWNLKPDAEVSRTSEEARSGSYSVKFTNVTPQTSGYYFNITQPVKVEPNTSYTYSFWAKGSGITCFVYKTLADNTFRWLAMNEQTEIGEWKQYSVTYTTGSEQTVDRVYLSTEGTTDEIYIDDVSLTMSGSSENLLKNSSFEEEEEAGKVIDSDPSVLWEYEEIFKEAEEQNMKISLLLSPQYFVNELYDMYPGLKDNGDGIGFTLLHPAAVEAVTYHIKEVLNTAKNYKSVNDICLANEPRNETKYGGDSSYYRSAWTNFLTEKYGSTDELNNSWETSYSSISEADFPSGINGFNAQSFDYVEFNDSVMTEWIRIISEAAKEAAPELPVHIKTMPYVSRADESDKRWLVGAGVDPEEIDEYVDINGNDSDLRFLVGNTSSYSDFIKWKRVQQSFWYEYLGSIKEAPVFNSEDHIIANGNKDFCAAHSKLIGMSQWMGAVHGRNMDCMWIWDRSQDREETYESIMYRPDVYEKLCEVNLDLKRLADEVYALIDAPYKVGILYSKTARVYCRGYVNAVYNAFEYSLYNGAKAGFITESTLSDAEDYELIIVPYAGYVTKDTLDMLKRHIQNGGRVIVLGENSLMYDESGAEHDAADVRYVLDNSEVISAYDSGNYVYFDEEQFSEIIAEQVSSLGLSDIELIDSSTGERVKDVEYTSAEYNGKTLISICNYDWDNDKQISIYVNGMQLESAKELRSGETISGGMQIKSFEPVLLEVSDEQGVYDAEIGGVFAAGKTVGFEITAENDINAATAATAVYGADGALENIHIDEINSISAGDTVSFENVLDASVSGKTVKVMLWEQGTMRPLAVSAGPDEGIIYRQGFSSEKGIKEISLADGTSLPGKPEIGYNGEDGCLSFEGWGQNTGLMLPGDITAEEFVMECDISYEKTKDYRGRSIGFVLIFGFRDDENYTYLNYYPETGSIVMGNLIRGEVRSRYAEEGRGASVMLGENETAHLKLAVQDGKLEFFVNGELGYTFDSRGHDDISNDFTEGGGLGVFSNADKTMISIDNISVRTPGPADKAFYSNAYMTPGEDSGFSLISEITGAITDSTVKNSGWGSAEYIGSGWDNTAAYVNVPVNGDYAVDLNFALKEPLNDSRYIGIAFGINEHGDDVSYSVAGVKENGDMFIEQKRITGGKDDGLQGAAGASGSCAGTIVSEKRNTDGRENYLLSYVPSGFEYISERDTNNRRHTLHLEVKNGIASMTFEGTSISCAIDQNSADGFVGIRAAGTGADIYSMRIVPL